MIDYNVRAERMGWLPSAPQLKTNPMQVAKDAAAAGMDAKDYVVKSLKDGSLTMSCEDPDHPDNWPRNMFVWRSNILGSSGKGHEYFLKHLLGTTHGVQGKDLGKDEAKPEEVQWHANAPEGKLDLLVTLDFRMSTTCLYSDIVLPTATWYEKNDLNTSDMHPFIHPLSTAVDPAWQAKQRLGDLQGLRQGLSARSAWATWAWKRTWCSRPSCTTPPARWPSPTACSDWKKGECELIPGKTAPQITVVERDYPNLYKRFTALGPLMDKVGNGGKGIGWNTQTEVEPAGRPERPCEGRGRDAGHAPHRDRHRRHRSGDDAGPRNQRPRGLQGLGGPGQADRAATTCTWHCTARTRRSASATSRRSRARSSARPPGRGWRARRSATTPATPTCTSTSHGAPSPDVSSSTRTTPGCATSAKALCSYRPPVHLKTLERSRRQEAQRQHRDPAELHHAAPEVGHPQHVQRQPA